MDAPTPAPAAAVAAVEAKPDEETDMPDIVEVTSLDDLEGVPIVEPDPLEVVWTQGGKLCRMKVVVKRPADYEGFPTAYMATKREAEMPAWKDKVRTFPHEGAHTKLLRDETIVSPAFLKEDGIEKSGKLDPDFFAQLHRKLLLVAGVDGDFFADWAQMRLPKAAVLRLAESQSGSEDSSPTKSSPDAAPQTDVSMPPVLPPTTTSPGKEVSSSAPTASATTSGSASPPPASPPRVSPRRRTLTSATSSGSPPSQPGRSA